MHAPETHQARGRPPGLRVRLLGHVRATARGVEFALGPGHQRAVFAALAVTPGRATPREELVRAVWGDSPPPSAAGNLYTYVSGLRRVLEPERDRWSAGDLLTSGGGTYCLHVPAEAVDACRFEALRERGRSLRTAGHVEGELAALDAALDLWQGEALVGVPGPLAHQERTRLGELYLATVERHAELMLDLGRAGEIVDALLKQVARHPMRESLLARAIGALAGQGRWNEATRLYARAADRLVEASGIGPGPALRDLHARLAGSSAHRGGLAAPKAPATVRRPVPFVGRVVEVARLERAVVDVAAGRGGSVWIDGEPGSGKSALLAEGLRDATAHGCRVGWCTGEEAGAPLAAILSSLGPDAVTSELFGSVLAATGPVNSMGDAVQRLVEELVVARVSLRCADRPQVLVIDAAQWMDDMSVRVWHALHRLTGALPLLLVTAARPMPQSRELRRVRRALPGLGTWSFRLRPLTDAESVELVRSSALLDRPTIGGIVAAAAGNPLYLRELAAARAGPGAPGRPSPGLSAVVSAQLAPLADDTRRLVRTAAFLGLDCAVTDLRAVFGRPVTALVLAAEEALAAGLLVEDGERLRFAHPVVRQVIYDATPAALRALVHRDFAQRIAEAGGDPARVAEQLAAGPVPLDVNIGRWQQSMAV